MAQSVDPQPHLVVIRRRIRCVDGDPMAGLSPADMAQPIRSIVQRKSNATVLMAEVSTQGPDSRT